MSSKQRCQDGLVYVVKSGSPSAEVGLCCGDRLERVQRWGSCRQSGRVGLPGVAPRSAQGWLQAENQEPPVGSQASRIFLQTSGSFNFDHFDMNSYFSYRHYRHS